jgi:hypothetical protein
MAPKLRLGPPPPPLRLNRARARGIVKPAMADIGKYNTLKIVKFTDFGGYLDGGELGEILLPRR